MYLCDVPEVDFVSLGKLVNYIISEGGMLVYDDKNFHALS